MKNIFRGKTKKDGRWEQGSLFTGEIDGLHRNAIITGCRSTGSPGLPEDIAFAASDDNFHEVEEQTIGQYLMSDSNNRPMFENDIVKQYYEAVNSEGQPVSGYHIGVAKLTTEGAQLSSMRHYHADGTPAETQPHKCKRIQIRSRRSKVIGNIFDNPHLLAQAN
jgi:uncharacterized phage protein (TIGR01671 family)